MTLRLPLEVRACLVAGSLGTATLATSCIREVDLVVVNVSDVPLVVTVVPVYRNSPDPRCDCPDDFVRLPLATGPAIDELGRRGTVWVPADTGLLRYRREGRRIDLTLPPRTVLRVDLARSNTDGELYIGGLSLWGLELTAPGVREVWTPGEILAKFKPRSTSLHVYEFRG